MRIVTGCILVAVASVVLSPSSQDLRKRYGEPDRERFAARPGISLTAQYGSDHLACQALIESPQTLFHQEQSTGLMSSESVSEVLEEVAPMATRGKIINEMNVNGGGNGVSETEYENVSITQIWSMGQEVRAEITFKRGICTKQNNPFQPGTRPGSN